MLLRRSPHRLRGMLSCPHARGKGRAIHARFSLLLGAWRGRERRDRTREPSSRPPLPRPEDGTHHGRSVGGLPGRLGFDDVAGEKRIERRLREQHASAEPDVLDLSDASPKVATGEVGIRRRLLESAEDGAGPAASPWWGKRSSSLLWSPAAIRFLTSAVRRA